MEGLNALKEKLQSDPKFQAMDYNNQRKVWSTLMVNELKKDDKFNKMGIFDKQKVVESLSYIEPAFSNVPNEFVQREVNLGKFYIDNKVYKKNEEIASKVKKDITTSLYAGALNKGILSTGIGKVTEPIVNALAPVVGTMTTDILESEDMEKAKDYLRTIIDDRKVGSIENTFNTIGALTGSVAGFVAVRKPLGAVASLAVKGVELGANALKLPKWIKAGTKFLSNAATAPGSKELGRFTATADTALKTWIKGSFIPWMGDATLDGIAGLTIEELGNVIEGEGDTIFKKGFMENLKTFGMYAAGDYAFGAIASVIAPLAKLGFKITKDTLSMGGLKKAAGKGFKGSNEDLIKVLAGLQEPTAEQYSWLREIAPQADDLRIHNKIVRGFEIDSANTIRNPLKKAWVTGDRLGKVIVPDGDGFRIRSKGKLIDSHVKVKNFESLIEHLESTLKKASKSQIESLEKAGIKHEWLINRVKNSAVLDSAYSVESGFKAFDSETSNKYIPPTKRSIINPLEYEELKKSNLNVIKGNMIKNDSGEFNIKPDINGKAVYVGKNFATEDQYKEFLKRADTKTIEGINIKPSSIADEMLIREGYDSVLMKDNTVRPLYKKKVKFIDENLDLSTGKITKNKISSVEAPKAKIQASQEPVIVKETPVENVVTYKDNLQKLYSKHNGILKQVEDGFESTVNGETIRVSSLDSAYKRLLIDTMGEDSIKAMLNEADYNIAISPGKVRIMKDGTKVVEFEGSFREAFINSDSTYLKIPSTIEEQYAVIDPSMGLNTNGNIVTGSKNEVMKYLSKYEDYKQLGSMKQLKKTDAGIIYKYNPNTYELRIDKYNYTYKFNDPTEALKMLRTVDNFSTMEKISTHKGLQLSFKGDTFVLKGNGKEWIGKTVEDFKKVLKENPDPTSVPDIYPDPGFENALKQADIDKEFFTIVPKNPAVIPPVRVKPPTKFNELGLIRSVSTFLSPTRTWMLSAAKKVGDPNLMKAFTKMEESLKLATNEINKLTDVVNGIFSKAKGKFLNPEERRAVFYYMTNTSPKVGDKLFKNSKLEFTPAVKEVGDQLRVVFNNLFDTFGISGEKYLTDYLPRMHKYLYDNPSLGQTMTGNELFSRAFKNNIPKDMKVFFEMERTAEIAKGLLNDDAYSVTMEYIHRGMKKLYSEDAWKQLQVYSNSTKLDAVVRYRINTYLEDVSGFNKSAGMKMANDIGKKFIRKIFKGKDTQFGDNLVNKILSLNYAVSMGLKPWLGIRNCLQPYMTFAPRFGIGVTQKAYRDVAKNGDKILREMTDAGIISLAPPIMIELNQGIIGRITSKTLKGFTTSDQITRAVAFQATKLKFDEGVLKFQKGVIKDIDSLEKYIGLNLIDNDYIKDYVKKAIVDGRYTDGLHRYASQTIEETMFGYRPSEKPLFGGRGLFGKLFWMYGTYSVGYATNIIRSIKNGTPLQKVAFVGRLGVTSAVIATTLKELGIKNNNFIPWTPMLFNGGPLIDVGYDVLQSFDSGYKGTEARKRLQRFILAYKDKNGKFRLGRGLPLSYQINNLQKGLKALDENDYWGAWKLFTSTPLNPAAAKDYY